MLCQGEMAILLLGLGIPRFLLLVKKTCLSCEAVLFSILFSCENSVQYETNTRDETKMQASFACSSQESFECSENLIV